MSMNVSDESGQAMDWPERGARAMSKRWRSVGWFAADPLDTSTSPFCRTAIVAAEDKSEAFHAAWETFHRTGIPGELLNWYVQPLQGDPDR